jgi:HEAT repeat protein
VIEELARQTNVSVIAARDAVYPDVSVSLQDVTVEQALRDLLKDYDTFFFYRGTDPDRPSISIKTVWVYRRGEGELLQPLPPEEWASTADLERGLSDPDPRVRAKAIEALVGRFPEAPGTVAAVQQALNDDDDNVRATALNAAVKGQVELSIDQLAALAASDRSPDVRLQALTTLALEPDVQRSVAETAAGSDPDPRVRAVAKEMLEELKASAPPPGQTRTP